MPDPGLPAAAARPLPSTRVRLLLGAGIAVPAAMALAAAFLAWVLRGESLLATLAAPQPWGRIILWATGGMAVSLGATTGLASLWPRLEEELERTGVQSGEEVLRLAGWPVMAVVVAGAGLGEELLFRGGLQPTLGIWLTAAAFGLAHGGWNLRDMWSLVLSAALAGVVFGYLYALSHLLWSAVLAHAGHNLLVTLYLLYRRRRRHGTEGGA